MNKNEDKRPMIGIFDILGLIFITLKLTGHITWSWVWVLSPWWIPLTILLVCYGIKDYYKSKENNNETR